ncbi:hypothetical protein BDW22DRAFT_1349346 [Trametopsis cervina]|nr:hypothetical protein BDW22DRAFT_1349346 [Trametopsis cervina]
MDAAERRATAQLASDRFDQVRFQATTGVTGLSNELIKHASRMIQPPDPYSMRRRFMSALPSNVARQLIQVHRLTAENSKYRRLLHEAIKVENANRALELYQQQRDNQTRPEHPPSKRESNAPRAQDQPLVRTQANPRNNRRELHGESDTRDRDRRVHTP